MGQKAEEQSCGRSAQLRSAVSSVPLCSIGNRLLGALQPVILKDALSLPELGYELDGPKGEVLAEAELAWPDQQLAVILDADQRPCFEAAGWRCWSIEDPPDLNAVDITAASIIDALQTPATAPIP